MDELVAREENVQDVRHSKLILLVEDDELLAALLVTAIELRTCYRIVHVSDGEGALEIFERIEPDVLVLDYHLPDMNGLDLYKYIHEKKHYEAIPTIFASADFPYATGVNKRTLRLNKPFSIQQFLDAISNSMLM